MVKVEIGGRPILEIPGVDIGERKINKNTRLTRSFTNKDGSVRTDSSRINFNWSQSVTSRLVITSDTDDFDEEILSHYKEEGFQIWYMPYGGDKAAYQKQLQHLPDPLELGETYAIVAYGDAAALVLESAMRPMPKLCAVVAYYPPYMPKTTANFPPSLNLTIHLAADQKFGTRHRRNYRYPGTQSGFAESDLGEYDKPAARVAWSRTLAALRRGFGIDPDLESVWDYHQRLRDAIPEKDDEDEVDELMETMAPDCAVNHVPTMTGGVGKNRLRRFYSEFFSKSRPKDFKTKLLSRTVGTDRIVDEMLVTFTHNIEMPWILPGVPPTGKEVEIVVVVVVAIRGDKVCAENVHWDQASALLQVGLLDPKYVPKSFKTKDQAEREVQHLPVLGAEAAKKVADEEKGRSNRLIPGW
ncbi:hypothetical protein LTS08_003532 [Lithohypha guttulata]|nr:hypothetical protein LTS08_003532 [Lithohypha guttulata]